MSRASTRFALLCLVISAPLLLAACRKKKDSDGGPGPVTQGYVGATNCSPCHGPYLPATVRPTYYQDWVDSAHGMTANMAPGVTTIVCDSNSNGTDDFRDGLSLASSPDWFTWTVAGGAGGDFAPALGYAADGDRYTMAIGARVFEIEKVVGIGRHRQLYLTRMGNSLYVLPALYDVDASLWSTYAPENWFSWTDADGDGLIDAGETITGLVYPAGDVDPAEIGRTRDSWEANCIGCHVTGIAAVETNGDGEFVAQYAEDGVGCEACHGPGRLHAYDLGARSLPDREIVNPRRLTQERADDLCMSCHSRGTSAGAIAALKVDYPWRADGTPFLPGQALSEAFALGDKAHETLHPLQGTHTHEGVASYGEWSMGCTTCHAAHNTTNLDLVRSTIATPNSGDRPVLFTSQGGAPGDTGIMGSAVNGTWTDACEVCHTETDYFRNDATTPDTTHNNGETCTDCHLHSRGFLQPESGGGIACDTCHASLYAPMVSTSPTSYHHLVSNASAVYPPGAGPRNCLSCHVDHDIFRPDLNPAAGRGANLRTDVALTPTTSSGFTNTDFISSGSGGVCLSCHSLAQVKGYSQPDGTTTTPSIPYDTSLAAQIAAYGASPHGSYTVNSVFSDAGTNTFAANCSKCHNDTLNPKSSQNAQTGTVKFGNHVSTLRRILAPLGAASPADPMEEGACARCHSTTSDAIGGTVKPTAGRDWYDAAPMAGRAERIFAMSSKPYVHPVSGTTGVHVPIEGLASGWNPASSRHVECTDCHNPHAAGTMRSFDTTGTFAQPLAPSNLAAGGPLAGVWGVDVAAWPAAWTAPAPAGGYTRVAASTYTWQVCLKCHSGYAYLATPPSGQTDLAREFNPNNAAYHAVIGASKTTFPPAGAFVSPWTKTSALNCSDCHTTDVKTDPQGPHGSAHNHILAGPFNTSTGNTGSGAHLCFKCHSFDTYGRDGGASGTTTGFSDGGENLHTKHADESKPGAGRRVTCVDCHAAVPHGFNRRAMLVVTSDPAPYNTGNATLEAADIPSWPASGTWKESSCSSVACH